MTHKDSKGGKKEARMDKDGSIHIAVGPGNFLERKTSSGLMNQSEMEFENLL
ncbi:hypothetical protein AMECASPLE_025183, partial [Ameca splendens]